MIDSGMLERIQRSNRVSVIILLAILILFAFALLAWVTLDHATDRENWQLLRETGVEIDAKVVGLNCANHGQVIYEWTVGGKPFRQGSACSLSCRTQRLGEVQTVRFLPGQPWVMACGYQLDQPKPSYVPVLLLWLFAVVVITIFCSALWPTWR